MHGLRNWNRKRVALPLPLLQKRRGYRLPNKQPHQKLTPTEFSGAFLVPYLLMLWLCGIPLFFMETTLGQFGSTGCITIFKIGPLFKGLWTNCREHQNNNTSKFILVIFRCRLCHSHCKYYLYDVLQRYYIISVVIPSELSASETAVGGLRQSLEYRILSQG